MTIPEPTFWGIVILSVLALAGLGAKVLNQGSAITALDKDKQDKTQCLSEHGNLRVEIMAISKDVAALARAAGLTPAPRELDDDRPPVDKR